MLIAVSMFMSKVSTLPTHFLAQVQNQPVLAKRLGTAPKSFLELSRHFSASGVQIQKHDTAKSGEEISSDAGISDILDRSRSFFSASPLTPSNDQLQLAAQFALGREADSSALAKRHELNVRGEKVKRRGERLVAQTRESRRAPVEKAPAVEAKQVEESKIPAKKSDFFNTLPLHANSVPPAEILHSDALRLLRALDHYRPKARANS
jgi:hypothetical protein